MLFKRVDEMEALARAGGGFQVSASFKSTDDLERIAMAAAQGNARIIIVGMESRPMADMIRIATAGRGSVQFLPEPKEG